MVSTTARGSRAPRFRATFGGAAPASRFWSPVASQGSGLPGPQHPAFPSPMASEKINLEGAQPAGEGAFWALTRAVTYVHSTRAVHSTCRQNTSKLSCSNLETTGTNTHHPQAKKGPRSQLPGRCLMQLFFSRILLGSQQGSASAKAHPCKTTQNRPSGCVGIEPRHALFAVTKSSVGLKL